MKAKLVRESLNQGGKEWSFTWDTAVALKSIRGEWRINTDPNDPEESYYLDAILRENGIEYRVVNPEGPGGGMPEIEYSAPTIEQLIPLMALLSASGYSEEEIGKTIEVYKMDGWEPETDEDWQWDDLVMEILG